MRRKKARRSEPICCEIFPPWRRVRKTDPGTERESAPENMQKLRERLAQLLPQGGIDPQRLAQEAALLADKCDISEEVARLKSHIEQYHALMKRRRKRRGKSWIFSFRNCSAKRTQFYPSPETWKSRATQSPSKQISKSFANRFKTLSEMARTGNLIIVSGPSGAGKSALVANVIEAGAAVEIFSFLYNTSAQRRRTERRGIFFCGSAASFSR